MYVDTKDVINAIKQEQAQIRKLIKQLDADDDITIALLHGEKKGLSKAIQFLESAPSADVREVMNSAWIPVSERLPMQGTTVIISANVGRLFSYVGEGWHDGYEWHDKDAFETKKTVTAWMPLPKPYRGDE